MASIQVRYIVNDVDNAIKFYTEMLGFKLVMHPAPAFAMLTSGDLRLVLSSPNPAGGGGSQCLMEPGRRRADGTYLQLK